MIKYLFLALLTAVVSNSLAQTISTDFPEASICAGASFYLSFSASGSFNSDNTFTGQLSDSLGNFNAAVIIGSNVSANLDSLYVTIPANAAGGHAYRIRVASSDPPITGSDNGSNIIINSIPPAPVISLAGSNCAGKDTLSLRGAGNATWINWYLNDTVISHADTGVLKGSIGVSYPQSVFVDSAGNIYILDLGDYSVFEEQPNGTTYIGKGVIAGGNGNGSAANQLGDPTFVYVDGLGNTYVADWINNRVQKFPAGSNSSTNGITVAGGNGAGNAGNQVTLPAALYFDAYGYMYVAGGNYVKKFPPNSTSDSVGVIVAGGNGTGAGANQLGNPGGVIMDAVGNLYVCDNENNRIQKFPANSDFTTNGITVAGGNGAGSNADQLNNPDAIYFDAGGSLLVSDELNNRIQKFPPGSTSATNGETIIANLNGSAGIFVDDSGKIYVCDKFNNLLKIFAPIVPDTDLLAQTAGSYTANYISAGGCYSSTSNAVLVNLTDSSSVAITPSQTVVCAGIVDTFTAIPVNGGSNPSFQWYQDGVAVGTNSSIYLASSVNNNDDIQVVMTSSLPCVISPRVTSNHIYITSVIPFVNLSSAQYNLCSVSAPDTMTAVPENGGSNPVYQWFRNGDSTGTNSPVYIASVLNTNDSIWVVMTSNALCAAPNSAVSNKITVNQTPAAPKLSTSGNGCEGRDSLALTIIGSASWINWYVQDSLVNTSSAITYNTLGTVAGGTDSLGGNQINPPYGVRLDKQGNLYVADGFNYRILKFPAGSDSATMGLTVAGGNGSGSALNQFFPTGLFVDDAGNIYVADATNNRILKFPAGSTSGTYGAVAAGGNGKGDSSNQLDFPISVFIDRHGNMYVADRYNNRIQMFPPGSDSSSIGVTVAGGNGDGGGANQFNWPSAVFVDPSDNLYVSDANRIQKFPPGSNSLTNGVTIAGGDSPGSTASELSAPMGIFVDATGSLYVADYINNRIQKFPPGSQAGSNGVTVAGVYAGESGGSASNELSKPNDVTLDAGGNIYIADQANNRIQKWAPSPFQAKATYVPTMGGSYTGTFITPGGCASAVSNAVNVNNSTFQQVSLTVSASEPRVCPGITDTFTATVTNAGSSPQYQWYDNNDPVGTDTSMYITTVPVSPDSFNVNLNVTFKDTGCLFDSIIYYRGAGVSYIGNTVLNEQIYCGQSFDGYDTAGVYTDTFRVGMCDSIRTLNLTFAPIIDTFQHTIYQGQSYDGHSATGTYYDTIAGINGCDTLNILYLTVININDSVWPGDANSDGVANNYDVLAVGLAFGDTGVLRPDATDNWIGQPCPAWVNLFSTGVNVNHADCNGNGIVDDSDIQVIYLNYSQAHNKMNPYQRKAGAPPLYLELTNAPVAAGDTAIFNIMFGYSTITAHDLYGVAFSVLYSNNLVQPNSVQQQISNSWLGTLGTDLLSLGKGISGQFDFAATRIDHQNRSGTGAIGQISFVSLSDINSDTASILTQLSITGVEAIDSAGNILPTNVLNTGSIVSGITEVTTAPLLSIFPNPASESINIVTSKEMDDVVVDNAVGQEITRQENIHAKQTTVDVSAWAKGIYFLQATIDGQRITKRFAVIQ